ncbi:serine/threonine protein phosphatase [Arachnia propionica]|uniref:Serine/threonine protein phosphatase n=1 Tax=Arachnia propionica TaxID=1750 RepID=A0A3P1T9T5_9ACTN|nr:metallophosphoesterase [Arachnia propionica]RRD06100.1 serine/threonine protein phosphatase [Arachnia propionica]
MRVAVFSDIHGKFLLPFKLVHHYQQETGRVVDAILQCGDMGAFPDPDALDKATSRHAARDRDELGFHDDFLTVRPGIAQFLAAVDVDMICVRGNHEDHEFLDRLENSNDEPRFPIDAYARVFVCRSGVRQELRVGDETLSFVGVGRIGDRKGRGHAPFIQPHERAALRRLHKLKGDVDVLISHDQETDDPEGHGMVELGELLNHVSFGFHFHGHTGAPFSRSIASNGVTESVKVKELEFDRTGVLPPGCMVILEKSGGRLDLEVVDQHLTHRFTKHTWKL